MKKIIMSDIRGLFCVIKKSLKEDIRYDRLYKVNMKIINLTLLEIVKYSRRQKMFRWYLMHLRDQVDLIANEVRGIEEGAPVLVDLYNIWVYLDNELEKPIY